MDILIKNALAVTLDAADTVYRTADIGIADGTIVYLGESAPAHTHAARVIDADGAVAMPGLVNMHTHSPMVLLRGYAEGLPLMRWLTEMVFPVEDQLTDTDMYWASLLAIMEMVSTGTTCFNDMYFGTAGTLRAVQESGIRAVLTYCATDEEGPADQNPSVLQTRRLHEAHNNENGGQVLVSIAPHAIYTCSPALLQHTADEAERLGAPLHIHLSETVGENSDCQAAHGMSPTAYLDSLGFFRKGVPTIVAHGVHLSDSDRAILAKYGVSVASCPESNCKLGSGICELDKLLETGVNVCIGTDGASSNNNLNMLEELHMAALLLQGVRRDAALLRPDDILRMGTVNGAKALGQAGRFGSLEVGKSADLILVDTKKPHMQPMTDVKSNLVYSAQGADVRLTMVQGRILYENGQFPTIDTAAVYENVQKTCDRVLVKPARM